MRINFKTLFLRIRCISVTNCFFNHTVAVQAQRENNLFVSIKDECSFVSLRDVERAMQVMVWFYKHVDTLGRLMRKVTAEQRRKEGLDVNEDDDDDDEEEVVIEPFEILCSDEYNFTKNKICVIDNPTECQNELFSSSRNPLKPVENFS